MSCIAYTYYVMLITKCTCAWLLHPLKLLPSVCCCHVSIQVSRDCFMLRLICAFLGCDLPIKLVLNCYQASVMIDWKIISLCTDSPHKLPLCNINIWTNRLTYFFGGAATCSSLGWACDPEDVGSIPRWCCLLLLFPWARTLPTLLQSTQLYNWVGNVRQPPVVGFLEQETSSYCSCLSSCNGYLQCWHLLGKVKAGSTWKQSH